MLAKDADAALDLGYYMINYIYNYGFDDPSSEITIHLYNLGILPEGRYKYIAPRLKTQLALIGSPPPIIQGLTNVSLTKGSYLVIFHETGCYSCDYEIKAAIDNYSVIRSKGFDIITVSSDNDRQIYEDKSKGFLWQHKLCDLKGFDGLNFVNYGVAGTPTIYLIMDGVVKERINTIKSLLQ